MALNTVGDLREMSRNHLNIRDGSTNARNGSDLSHFDALVWSAHSAPRPGADFSFLDQGLNPFFKSPAGKALLKFGHIRGDVGADEISEGIMHQLESEGFTPLFLAPRMGGRTLKDHNRSLNKASLFPVPSDVDAKLNEAYSLSMDTLFAYFSQYRDRIRILFQPHTMGSGEFDEAKVEILEGQEGALKLLADSDFQAYQAEVIRLVDEWDDLYTDACNNGQARPDVCIPTAVANSRPMFPPIGIADQDLGFALADSFGKIDIRAEFNNPFLYVSGYPGTRLAEMAAEVSIPQVTFDLAKRHLLKDGEVFRASTFAPDTRKAMRIGQAVGQAARDVIRLESFTV